MKIIAATLLLSCCALAQDKSAISAAESSCGPLGKDAEVLDVCGPLEVFAGSVTKDGNQLFAPYMVAPTKNPVTIGGRMQVVTQ